MKEKTLSERMGLASKETAVSALIAATLEGDGGSEALAALLGEENPLCVRKVSAEHASSNKRFDIVVVFEDARDTRVAIIEVKVTAHEGAGQLERYLEASSNHELLESLVREKSEVPAIDVPTEGEVAYLTVEQEQREGVRCVTFEQWEHTLRKRGFDFGQNGVTTFLLEDALKYLGRQRSQEIALLSSIGPSTKLLELRETQESGIVLEKKLTEAIVGVLTETFAELNNADGEPFDRFWTYRGKGGVLELGYYRASWLRDREFAGSTSIDGFRIAQVIRTGVYELSQEQPSVKITARFQAIPYYPRKELERRMPEAAFNQVMSLRATYRRELLSVAGKEKDLEFKSTNYYLQLGEVRVDLTLEDSLRTVAQALWDKAVVLADAMDGALEALDVGSTQRHQHPEHSDARFADLLT